jgi:hypothetical protein
MGVITCAMFDSGSLKSSVYSVDANERIESLGPNYIVIKRIHWTKLGERISCKCRSCAEPCNALGNLPEERVSPQIAWNTVAHRVSQARAVYDSELSPNVCLRSLFQIPISTIAPTRIDTIISCILARRAEHLIEKQSLFTRAINIIGKTETELQLSNLDPSL